MALRSIQLRWRGRCFRCGRILAAGDHAEFDTEHHELWCDRCASGQLPLLIPDEDDSPAPATAAKAKPTSATERAKIRSLIDETKAVLDAHHQAS